MTQSTRFTSSRAPLFVRYLRPIEDRCAKSCKVGRIGSAMRARIQLRGKFCTCSCRAQAPALATIAASDDLVGRELGPVTKLALIAEATLLGRRVSRRPAKPVVALVGDIDSEHRLNHLFVAADIDRIFRACVRRGVGNDAQGVAAVFDTAIGADVKRIQSLIAASFSHCGSVGSLAHAARSSQDLRATASARSKYRSPALVIGLAKIYQQSQSYRQLRRALGHLWLWRARLGMIRVPD
jgi:hypothetical protein